MGGRRSEEEYGVRCKVLRVRSPMSLKVGPCTTTAGNRGGGDKEKRLSHPNRRIATADLAELLLESSSRAVSFSRVKVSRLTPFLSIGEAPPLPDDSMNFMNSVMEKIFNLRRRSRILGCFWSLDEFVSEMGLLPRKFFCGSGRGCNDSLRRVRDNHDHNEDDNDDVERFRRLARGAGSDAKNDDSDDDDNVRQEVLISQGGTGVK